MNSFGLDTSVLLRLLVGEPESQAQVALTFLTDCFNQEIPVFVSDLVVAEAYYALHYHYKVPKKEALEKLRDMFDSKMITSSEYSTANVLLSKLENQKGKLGIVDRMIYAQYQMTHSKLATFEKASKQWVNAVVLL